MARDPAVIILTCDFPRGSHIIKNETPRSLSTVNKRRVHFKAAKKQSMVARERKSRRGGSDMVIAFHHLNIPTPDSGTQSQKTPSFSPLAHE